MQAITRSGKKHRSGRSTLTRSPSKFVSGWCAAWTPYTDFAFDDGECCLAAAWRLGRSARVFASGAFQSSPQVDRLPFTSMSTATRSDATRVEAATMSFFVYWFSFHSSLCSDGLPSHYKPWLLALWLSFCSHAFVDVTVGILFVIISFWAIAIATTCFQFPCGGSKTSQNHMAVFPGMADIHTSRVFLVCWRLVSAGHPWSRPWPFAPARAPLSSAFAWPAGYSGESLEGLRYLGYPWLQSMFPSLRLCIIFRSSWI